MNESQIKTTKDIEHLTGYTRQHLGKLVSQYRSIARLVIFTTNGDASCMIPARTSILDQQNQQAA